MAHEEDCTCLSCTVGDVRELPSAEEVCLLADAYDILLHSSDGVALISAIDPEIEPEIKTATRALPPAEQMIAVNNIAVVGPQ